MTLAEVGATICADPLHRRNKFSVRTARLGITSNTTYTGIIFDGVAERCACACVYVPIRNLAEQSFLFSQVLTPIPWKTKGERVYAKEEKGGKSIKFTSVIGVCGRD